MKKLCESCQKPGIKEIAYKDGIYYFCPSCQQINERFITVDGLYSKLTSEGLQHTVAGVVVRQEDKIMIIKRRVWPFTYGIPSGHLKTDEGPEDGAKRKLMEETGIIANQLSLIFHGAIENDPCRYGAKSHEWFLYQLVLPKNKKIDSFLNSELSDSEFITPKQALKKDLFPVFRHLVKNVILNKNFKANLPKKTDLVKLTKSAVDHARTFEERKDEIIYHVSRSLFRVGDLANKIEVAVQEISSALGFTGCSVLELKPSGDYKEIYSTGEKIGDVSALVKLSISSGKIITPDYGKISNRLVAVPVTGSLDVAGIIIFKTIPDRIFSEAERQFLQIIGSMMGLSIENSDLYHKSNNRAENLAKLFGITSVSARQTRNTIKQIVDTVPALLEAERCDLLIYDPQKKVLGSFALTDQEKISLPDIPLGKGISSKVFLSQKPILVNNALENADVLPKHRKALNMKSQLSVPVQVGEKSIGVLHIINKIADDFDEEDLKLASIVASRIGIKIENTSLISELKNEKDFLNSVIENSNEGILIVNSKGNITVWNRFLEDIFGIKASEIIGKPGFDLAKKIGTLDLYWKVFRSMQKNYYFEKEITAVSGERVLLGTNIFFIGAGNDQSAVIIARDITKERNLLEAKNELISTATHELRTPLTAVKGYLSMAQNPNAGILSDKQRKYLGKASESTERLVGLIEDLLGALRIDENRVILEKQAFSVDLIIKEAVANLSSKAQAKDIRIFNKLACNSFVFADPVKSKQIIENLLDNAIKYTRDHGKIIIKTEKHLHDIKISIKDTGVGINKADMAKVFERFSRVNNPLSVEAGGTGLGLYIAKNLVERQGGRIWLSSEINRGTTFNFTLPVTDIVK